MTNYVIVDIETTWLSAYKHHITEIAAVRFDGEKIIDQFHSLVNPERHIPSFITKLTWITNEMVADAPVIKDVLEEFLPYLWDDIFVAHNATFDYNFITFHTYQHFNRHLTNERLCTRMLVKKNFPEIPKRNLWFLCEYFKINNNQAHRALSDVMATVELFTHCLKKEASFNS